MTLKKTYQILSNKGIKLILEDYSLKTYDGYYNEDYEQIEYKDEKWYYIHGHRNKKEIKYVYSNDEAIKVFFFRILHHHCFKKILSILSVVNNDILYHNVDFTVLKELLLFLNVPSLFYSFDKKRENAFFIEELSGLYHIIFINNNNVVIVDYSSENMFSLLTYLLLLMLFKEEERNMLSNKDIKESLSEDELWFFMFDINNYKISRK